jgi:hypothetical protein
VRPYVIGAAKFLVVPTLVLVVVAAFAPGRAGLVVRIYALAVCGTALVVALDALVRAYQPEAPLRGRSRGAESRRQPPPSLARLETLAALGVASSFDLQYRFVPRLRGVTAGLLASRRRVELDTNLDAASRILGTETWELVGPSRPAPGDRIGRGITPSELSRVVDTLEAI